MPLQVIPRHLLRAQGSEVKAMQLRDRVLQCAAEMDAEVNEVVVAVADVLAVAVANYDRGGGGTGLADRLDAFLKLVEAAYRRHRDNMATAALGGKD